MLSVSLCLCFAGSNHGECLAAFHSPSLCWNSPGGAWHSRLAGQRGGAEKIGWIEGYQEQINAINAALWVLLLKACLAKS